MNYKTLFLLTFTFLICLSQAQESARNNTENKTGLKLTQEGDQYLSQDDLPKAIIAYKRAILYSNMNAKAHFGLGFALEKQGNFKDAIHQFQTSLIFAPGLVSAYDHLGIISEKHNELNQALLYYLKASALDPDFSKFAHESTFNIRDVNSEREQSEIAALQTALKDNTLKNKSVYIYPNDSIDDIILFSRYLLLLKEKGALVTFTSPSSLSKLLQHSMDITIIDSLELEENIKYDFKSSLNSLPFVFDTTLKTIPFTNGYLKVPAKNVAEYAEWVAKKPLRIGIAVFGDTPEKTIPLEELKIFKDIPSASFYLLQSIYNKNEWVNLSADLDISKLAENFDSFDEIAGAISTLDLVITTDNSIAEIASALNKPTWVLLTTTPSWQWFLKGDTSPWYNSAKLFRQIKEGQWQDILQEVQKSLNLKTAVQND